MYICILLVQFLWSTLANASSIPGVVGWVEGIIATRIKLLLYPRHCSKCFTSTNSLN